jgi:hypothetical protein
MNDVINGTTLQVIIQENGIIRDSSDGLLIARLVDEITFRDLLERKSVYATQQRRQAAAMKLLEYIERLGENGTDIRFGDGIWSIEDHWNETGISSSLGLISTIEKLSALQQETQQNDDQQRRSDARNVE